MLKKTSKTREKIKDQKHQIKYNHKTQTQLLMREQKIPKKVTMRN